MSYNHYSFYTPLSSKYINVAMANIINPSPIPTTKPVIYKLIVISPLNNGAISSPLLNYFK